VSGDQGEKLAVFEFAITFASLNGIIIKDGLFKR